MHPPSQSVNHFQNKSKSLELAYSNVKHHVDSKTGVIPWVEQLPTQYAGDSFSIYLAKHPILSHNYSLASLQENIKASSSAIAPTKRQAKILAICEALERWACVSQGNELTHSFNYKEISTQAIHPRDLHCISEKQYKNRHETNLKYPSGGGFIPEPLNESHEIAWCPVYDMLAEEWKYILKSSCYFGHQDDGHVYSIADSRGVAAGPNQEFCIWHAMLELIETDQGAIWNANQLPSPEVSIERFDDPYLLSLKNIHHCLGRELWVLDISLDISGVTVMVALSRDNKTGNIIKGFGTHPLPNKALEKAIMECCQMLPNVIKEGSDKITAASSKAASSKAISSAPSYFEPAPGKKVLGPGYYSERNKATSIYDLIQSLRQVGINPLVQDVSRSEINLCVMRVFGVGMRPWFDRRGPGRLYEVPVKLGLRTHPIKEEEVTSKPIEL